MLPKEIFLNIKKNIFQNKPGKDKHPSKEIWRHCIHILD